MTDILISQFILFVLIFIRLTSMIVVAPLFGHEAVPPQVKIVLGLFFALTFYPIASKTAPNVSLEVGPLVILALGEAVIGMLMGFAVNLVFVGSMIAGEFIAFNMGLGFARFFDPMTNESGSVLATFLYLISLLIFLVINGHHFLLESLQLSYSYVPVGGLTFNESLYKEMLVLTKAMFVVAVKISAPVVVALFLTNVVLGVLARVVPQMNVFLVGFPLQVSVGLVVLFIISPLMIFVFKKLLLNFEESFFEFVKVI